MHAVTDELERVTARKNVMNAVDAERKARMIPGYWVTDEKTIAEIKEAINADIVRKAAVDTAISAMEIERISRVQTDLMADAAEELRRLVAQKQVVAAAKAERERRVTENRRYAVEQELLSEIHRRDAQRLFTSEQRDRVAHPLTPSPEFLEGWAAVGHAVAHRNAMAVC